MPHLHDRWHIEPHQVVDFLAMVGDSSDDVPGLPGIGEKTASQLLSDHGNIVGIYSALDQLKPRKREAFEDNWLQLVMAKSLLALRDDLPLPLVGSAAEISLIDLKPWWDNHAAEFTKGCDDD